MVDKKIYWKLRHLISPKVWNNYYENSLTKRRDFYSIYIKRKHFKTVFEFGCASGPNLYNIDKNVPWKLYYYGYDISAAAIKFAKNKFKKDTYFFSTNINQNLINQRLDSWGLKKFNLSIYDRVLYLLNEEEVKEHFKKYKSFLEDIIIDDFHNSESKEFNEIYFSKNYESILYDFGFKLKKNEPSGHFTGDDDFFKRNARRLIFEKFN